MGRYSWVISLLSLMNFLLENQQQNSMLIHYLFSSLAFDSSSHLICQGSQTLGQSHSITISSFSSSYFYLTH